MVADYSAGGRLARFAGKDITAACAKGFAEGSDKADPVGLTEGERKAMDKYMAELKKNYQVLGAIKDKGA